MTKHRINQLLDERGMTRYELAKRAGLSQKQIYQIAAAGEIPPKTYWATLTAIRDALGLEHVEEMLEQDK